MNLRPIRIASASLRQLFTLLIATEWLAIIVMACSSLTLLTLALQGI
tara:strand:- start:253302 stop:253442 length:141 start_codon:yes stop_codon:yes gene_type:complete